MRQFLGLLTLGLSLALSGCVSQSYTDENNPVIQNDVSNTEIAMTRISLGLGYLKMGNTTQAKLNLEKAKRYAPNLIQVYTAFAHYYEYVDEPAQAEAAYAKALSIKSDDANTLNNYGVFLCRQGNLAKAEEVWLQAVAVPSYTQVSETYENLANCQLENNHFSQADFYLRKAIDHSPTNASALLQLTRLEYAQQHYLQAEKLIHKYEKATRKFNPEALALSYKVFQKRGKANIAKNYAAMLIKMFPNSLQAKQYILNGLTYIEADKLADKLSQTKLGEHKNKRVVKLSPKNSIAENKTEVVAKSSQIQGKVASQHHNDEMTIANQQVESQPIQKPKQLAPHKTKMLAHQEKQQPALPEQKLKATKQTNSPSAKQSMLGEAKRLKPKLKKNGQIMMTLPVHIVQSGDSLFSISKKYNIRLSYLLRWNHKTQKSILRVGDVIYLSDPKKAVKG